MFERRILTESVTVLLLAVDPHYLSLSLCIAIKVEKLYTVHRTMRQVRVLNVAEKPSVARALANVFVHTNGTTGGGGGTTTIDRGMRRDVHQIFEVEGVAFPALHTQGNGITYQPHQHGTYVQ